MGIFDIFSNSDAQNAAAAQTAGLTNAYSQLVPLLNQGTQSLQSNYTAGLQPFLQNYNNAQGGVNQLDALLGVAPSVMSLQPSGSAAPGAPATGDAAASGAPTSNVQTQAASLAGSGVTPNGAAGATGGASPASSGIQQTLQNLPGYQFALNQGAQNVMRNQAATGQLNSGATNVDLQNQAQGQASQNYFNYVNALQPYLASSNANAQGIGNMYAGLGQGINQNFNTQGAAAYGTQAGIGNAQAQADYTQLAQSGALFGGLMSLGGNALGAYMKSDERAKDDIEPVGELFDGQPVFKYRYKGDRHHQIGLMAQEVEKRDRGAVLEFRGVKHVNYDRATDLAAELGKFLKAA